MVDSDDKENQYLQQHKTCFSMINSGDEASFRTSDPTFMSNRL